MDTSVRNLKPGTAVQITSSKFWRLAPADMRRRWWFFRFFDWLTRRLPFVSARRGLLVIRMDGIGDMVLFRNTLDQYSDVFKVPKNEICVLGCKSWESIAGDLFSDYGVFFIDEHIYAKRLVYRIWVNVCVRRLNVAVTVCDAYFRRALMADSLAYVESAPRTVMALPYINSQTRAEYYWYLSQVSDVIDTGPYPRHEIERHATFVSYFTGESPAPVPPQLNWRETPVNLPIEKPYVVFNPGSNERGRCWPLDNYKSLANRLTAYGWQVVFVGKTSENLALNDASVSYEDELILDLTGKTTLPQLFDIMNHSVLVVSNDSGPAHVAAGLGVPTVIVLGGGHFGCFVPYPESIRPANTRFVYKRMNCYHCFWRCHKRESLADSFPCIAAVTVDHVWSVCAEFLPESGPI